MGKYVSGADRLREKLKRFPKAVRAEVRAAVIQGATDIVAAQKALAPKRTGKLAASIQFVTGDRRPPAYATLKGEARGDPDTTALITAGNTDVRYAHLVEFGTAAHPQGGTGEGTDHPGSQPQPFFFPGYRLTRKKAKGRVSRAVAKAARKAAT